MIIDITKSGYQPGYLPKVGTGVFHPFFATANCAVRREAIAKAGAFDARCATGEDIDLSIRIARAGYEMWFEPTAKVVHHHRHTLRGLVRQWFAYGLGHAYLWKKHSRRARLEVFRYDLSDANPSPFGIRRILAAPFPAHAMVFVTRFHAMHLAIAGAIVAAIAGARGASIALAALALVAAGWYFGIRFDLRRPLRSAAFAAIRYVADSAYVLGGLIGGVREGMIYVEATRTRRATTSGPGGSAASGSSGDRGVPQVART